MIRKIALLPVLLILGCSSINQIDHIHGKGLLVNEKVCIDDEFIYDLWTEAGRVTGIGGSIPEIHVTLNSPTFPVEIDSHGGMTIHHHYGTYYSGTDTVYVYFGDSIDAFRDPKEVEVFMYGVLAHEFLHRIYRFKYKAESTGRFDHCKMIESGDLEKLSVFIESRFKSNGDAKEYNLEITEKACYK